MDVPSGTPSMLPASASRSRVWLPTVLPPGAELCASHNTSGLRVLAPGTLDVCKGHEVL